MKTFFYKLMVTTLFTLSFSNASAFSYVDDFEGYEKGANLSSGYNESVTAGNAVTFPSGVDTELVSLTDGVPGINEAVPDSPVNQAIQALPPKSRSGNCTQCAIRFSYSGSSDLSQDAWSEQRFSINSDALPQGKNGLTNFWLQYDLYIPENYHFRDPEPNASNWYGGGDKVLVVWADENSDPIKPMLQIARLMKRNGSSGETWDPDTAYLEYWFASFDPVTGERRFFDDKGIEGGYQVLIDPVIDRGNWQRRTLHVRMPTSEGSNDGVVEYWVERRTGTDRSITKKLIDVKSGNFFGGNKNYLNRGYLLGWSNAGYNYDVTYLIDNFILANSIDSIDASAIKASSNENRLPNPPSLTIE